LWEPFLYTTPPKLLAQHKHALLSQRSRTELGVL
jgi:hypothetical protein